MSRTAYDPNDSPITIEDEHGRARQQNITPDRSGRQTESVANSREEAESCVFVRLSVFTPRVRIDEQNRLRGLASPPGERKRKTIEYQ